jgi:peptidoglycan/xylan/chitin deacetylase (PgdA/CDA1 family)
MRRGRLLFALVGVAVFGVSLGAGATVGYDRARWARGTDGGDAAAIVSRVDVRAGAPTPGAVTDAPSTAPATSRAGAAGSPSPSPIGTPVASWPLVAADSPGPPYGFALRVPVVMYHRVAPADQVGRSLSSLVVPPDVFAAQLEALVAAGWRSITAADLAADLADGVAPPPRTFVITFDDGRSDGYTEALPILQRLDLVATFYVITGRISNDSGSLSASQLRRMAAAGMEIGSHTVGHVRLTTTSLSSALDQLSGSAARIAAVTGQRPTTFAYPFGTTDPLRQDLVRQAGYAMAFTEADGCWMSWPTRLMAPRVRVTPSTTPEGLLRTLEVCTGGA